MQQWIDVAQILGNLAVVVSVFFLLAQLRLSRQQAKASVIAQAEQVKALAAQADASNRQVQGQNVFHLIRYLERPENLAARKTLLECPRAFPEWLPEDYAAADLVARNFQMAAVFQYSGVLPENWVQHNYGGAVLRYWRALVPYIADLRRRSDPLQRRDFEKMYDEVSALPEFAGLLAAPTS